MRFPLIHTGRRFFFLTLVVKGRQPILSRLVREEKRPVLTALGDRIVETWRSLHQRDAHLTASDFVIMPDHIHLLLIVHSEGAYHFDPIAFVRWFQQQTNAIAWEQDTWINISFDARQLSMIRRYIKMNPARYFWKHDHADLFRAHAPIKHPVLNPAFRWTAVGDITLLASPFLYLVRLTRKKSLEALEPEIQAHLTRAQQGWTPVCGFISPGERAFGKRLKALPQSRWIKTVPYGLPSRYDPSVEDAQWIAASRQLVLSSFDATAFPPFKITRAGCLLMNERTEQMVDTLSTLGQIRSES
jgi:REP element-mobilizing transposase RayT